MDGTVRRQVEQSGGEWNSQAASGIVSGEWMEQSGGGWNSQRRVDGTVRRRVE